MWLSKTTRRGVLIGAVLALAGCGYEPAFGPSGSAEVLRNQVTLPEAKNRNQFDFNAQFEKRLGHASAGKYKLSYSANISRDGVAQRVGGDVFRYNLVGTATFTLRDAATDDVLETSSVQNFASYSIGFVDSSATTTNTSANISSVAARQDANRRLMVMLADQVVMRLVATSGNWSQ